MSTTMTAPKLTGEQVSQYHREGFLRLDQFTTVEDIARVRDLIDGLFDRFDQLPKELAFDLGDVKHHDGRRVVPQINTAVRFEPRLKETHAFQNAIAIARQLLGPDANYSYDHAIYKPARSNKEVPWHQDLSYGRNPNAICFNANFWIPLQEATIENGCMWFIPWSHWGNLLPHHPAGHNPKVHTLECDPIDAGAAVPCPLPAGGATIQHGKTLHYTGPNNTDAPRKAWIINVGYPVRPTWIKT